MVGSFYLPLVILSSVVGMGFALFSWLNRDRSGTVSLTVFLVAASCWALAEGLTVASGEFDVMRSWTQVSLSLSGTLPIAWLAFCLGYTGSERFLTHRILGLFLIEPVVFAGLVWTNASHGYVWSNPDTVTVGEFLVYGFEFGPAFWLHQGYSYLILAVGVLVLVRELVDTTSLPRWQRVVLPGVITVPMLMNGLYLFEFLPRGFDPNGVSYVFAGIVVAVVALETEFVRVAPVTRAIGREQVLSELDDVIVILDDDDRIIDANPAADDLLGSRREFLGAPLAEVLPTLAETLAKTDGRTDVEIGREGKIRYYDVTVSSLSRGFGTFSGRVVSLRDVTRRREREQRLDVLNRLLRHNIRNELNLVRGKIELTREGARDEEYLDEAIEAVDSIVTRSNKVGRLSRLLEGETSERLDLATELEREYETGGLCKERAQITLDLPDELLIAGGESLVAIFDELVSNAVEHNDSDTPQITITVDDERSDGTHAVLAVIDNGPGIDQQEVNTFGEGRETPLQHSSGVGLWLVNWLVHRAGGTISFENTNDGCTVRVRLPRARTNAVD